MTVKEATREAIALMDMDLGNDNGNRQNVTLKESYERFVVAMKSFHVKLCDANTEVGVNDVLEEFQVRVEKMLKDPHLVQVEGMLKELNVSIHATKLHDSTRKVIEEILENLINRGEELLKEKEEKKEMAEKLKRFFLECAEHSEEILQIVDLNKIFGQ